MSEFGVDACLSVIEEQRAKLRKISDVVRMHRSLLEPFTEDAIRGLDPETGLPFEDRIDSPEYAYRLLGVVQSCLAQMEFLATT